jgi:hypothetical protein
MIKKINHNLKIRSEKMKLPPACLLALLLFISPWCHGQGNMISSPFTTADFREKFNAGLIKWSILNNLSSPLNNADDEYDFQSAFWPMELIVYKTDYVRQRLTYAFSKAESCSNDFQRRLVEIAYANWREEFRPQVEKLMQKTTDAKVFAICAEYLWQNGRYSDEKAVINTLLQEKFDTVQNNAILMMLHERLERKAPPALPPLTDIFSEQFAPGLTVMYSFQRHDRDYPGLVVVRRPDGRFVRDSSGNIFSVPQLARSITNLPFYLTNGNTPQGIYRMSGFDVSRSRFIGPTQNIQLSMPYEIPVDSFLISPAPGDTSWTIDKYSYLLPGSWRQYVPIYHSYYAGDAGRTAIIAHGTTIDPDYYKGRIYYPQTPSQGCLCTYESWSPVNGQRLQSDQQKLVNAIKAAGNGTGYAIVIELNDEKSPVRPTEILPYITAAEKAL